MSNLEGILWSGGAMSPSEEQWASWKCGGGPHRVYEHMPAAPAPSSPTQKVTGVVLMYAGTESARDMPETPQEPSNFMAHIIP